MLLNAKPFIPSGLVISTYITGYVILTLEVIAWIATGGARKFVTQFSIKLPGEIQKLPPEYKMIADAFGVTITWYRVVPEWMNAAAARGNTLIVGTELLSRFSSTEARAVVTHEIGHLRDQSKGLHFLILFALMVPMGLSLHSLSQLPTILAIPPSVSLMGITLMLYQWLMEYRADRFAKEALGAREMQFALRKLRRMPEVADTPSFTHPGLTERINRLDR